MNEEIYIKDTRAGKLKIKIMEFCCPRDGFQMRINRDTNVWTCWHCNHKVVNPKFQLIMLEDEGQDEGQLELWGREKNKH